ncbi:class I SAM-dependent methyltransferase [Microlunatus flavus]|uniref:Methyltransferase domain-containing protein n=1 Tax=Microlunatus flavus TaxID=1036181 RepID=A0A1H9N1L5_9ACTN|nr:class I SAM-dependent methyltransferase [Microlunatus flavus]SER29822.1 Methyltransferase domain-containing protein [Microlunatus flavus]
MEPERSLFDVSAGSYDRLIGRYLPTIGVAFADAAGVGAGQRVLDVGCGPGGLTSVLVGRVGAEHVAAIDPSRPFVAACRERNPGVDVREGVAEELPYADGAFDASLASLVVGFMSDAGAGVAEMRRVTRRGGRIALSFWTLDGMPLLQTFWSAASAVTGEHGSDDTRLGRRDGDLVRLLEGAGAADVVQTRITGRATYADVDDFWSSFTGGAGPVGAYARSLAPEVADRVRDACDRLLGHPRSPFTLEATAWCAVGTS